MAMSNRVLMFGAAVTIALIVGITAWNARTRSAQATTAEARQAPPAALADGRDAQAAEPAYADIWAGRARPPMPRRTADGKPGLLMGSPEDRERAKRAYEELGRTLEDAHRKQAVDPAWKGETETAMRGIHEGDALKGTGLAPEEFDSDCRSKSCRISATFDGMVDAQDWANMFTTMTGSQFRSARYVTNRLPDGRTEVRIYGNRR